jgi:3-hydroxybutyryl-CoA dehydrogenase
MHSTRLAPEETVTVVGCGTMGAGIAQVAALAGHPVQLFDIRAGAAANAQRELGTLLKKLAAKGTLDADRAERAVARIQPIESVSGASPARLVIEAVQEDLVVKRSVFAALEDIIASDAVLATNTSSLSITAIAAGLKYPARMCGLHFFNPAPLMPLVEVVSGLETDASVMERMTATVRAWGKTPVRARSTPGFIVNRVARPFYAEALRALSEGAADPATLDALVRESGGFRMGPFELMDLIGLDINFAVTSSVHAAFFGDSKFTPSLLQQELVQAGRLGRKTGGGFYDYRAGAEKPAPRTVEPLPAPRRIIAFGDLGPAACLVDMALERGMAIERAPGNRGSERGGLKVGDAYVVLTDGRSATVRAAAESRPELVTFDLARDYRAASRLGIAAAAQTSPSSLECAAAFFQALGKQVSPLNDIPGMIVMRTVAMLVNEAADTVLYGVASAADVNLAMVKGTNYPIGPLAWSDEVGSGLFLEVADRLFESYGDPRYRASRYLRDLVAQNGRFEQPSNAPSDSVRRTSPDRSSDSAESRSA